MAKRTNATQSATRDLLLHGREGYCIACEQSVAAHFGPDNRWIGCPAAENPDAQFLLVPDRRVTPAYRATRREYAELLPPYAPPVRRTQAAEYSRSPIVKALRAVSQVRYRAVAGMRDRKVQQLPSRDHEVFASIARSRTGLLRRELLTLHVKRDDTTGVVDGAVRRLRLKKLIRADRS